MAPPISIPSIVLLLLVRESAHGAVLQARAAECTQGGLVLVDGGLYKALLEMERAGLIKSLPPPRTRKVGKPPRPYLLTEEGRAEAHRIRSILLGLLGLEARP